MEYKTASFIESSGNGDFGVKILVSMDRDLTSDEKKEIDNKVEKIHDMLIYESKRLDPKLIAQAKDEKAKLIGLFDGHSIFVEERPNGYMNDPMFPWFTITTKIGRIDIGWRKRVILIDWSDTIINKSSQELFPNEEVTKFDSSIHAWGYEKAKEYLNVLLTNFAPRICE